MFFINGNQGSHEQFPLIANSLEAYLNQLTDMQANHDLAAIYKEITGEKLKLDQPGKVHLNIEAYGFKVDK